MSSGAAFCALAPDAARRRRSRWKRRPDCCAGTSRCWCPASCTPLSTPAAVMARIIDFYGVPDDLDAGVAARMERQQILYRGNHRFHFILAEQALRTRVGSTETMIGQLDRLLTLLSLPRVSLGVLPSRSEYRVPTNQFIMFDDRVVHVENVSAEVAVTQPREIALYAKLSANSPSRPPSVSQPGR
jgi:hypothetical protein